MTFQLNEEQVAGLERIPNMEDYFLLKGYAGTGKSTVITEWVKQTRVRPKDSGRIWRRPSIVLTAPTNKAAGVLREMVAERGLRTDVSTIHSLLSLKLRWHEDKQILVQDDRGDNRFGDYDFVVVDECGMLDEELMGYICRAQKAAENKVIFMGDPCQLPPISEKGSRSFGAPNNVELTRVMRQAEGNNIIQLGIYLREIILSDRPHYPNKIFTFVDDKTIFYHPVEKYEDEILEAFADPGDSDIRHVAWTNKVVDSWNNKIRDFIYGEDRNEWVNGEDIVTTAPVFDPFEDEILFNTDTLLTIRGEPETVIKHDVECWKLRCKGYPLFVRKYTSSQQFNVKKQLLLTAAKADKTKWREFYEFMETFAYIKPAHSLTVHRSQGSTFDDVYVSFANILANPGRKESLQCLYVAATRPRNRLILV